LYSSVVRKFYAPPKTYVDGEQKVLNGEPGKLTDYQPVVDIELSVNKF
jgi:hypothetical protein